MQSGRAKRELPIQTGSGGGCRLSLSEKELNKNELQVVPSLMFVKSAAAIIFALCLITVIRQAISGDGCAIGAIRRLEW